MKRIALLLAILLNFGIVALSQNSNPLRVEIVGEEECNRCGYRPTYDTRVKFRVTNALEEPVKLYGTNLTDGFRPRFTQLNFNSTSGTWTYPTPDGKPRQWTNLAIANSDTVILKPGEFLEFDNAMSTELEAGRPFKLAFYIQTAEDLEPVPVVSEELMFVGRKDMDDKMLPSLPSPSRSLLSGLDQIFREIEPGSPLQIEVIRTESCARCGHRPTYDTTVWLRVTNISKSPIELAGTDYGAIKEFAAEHNIPMSPVPFRPLTHHMMFDGMSMTWKYRTQDGKAPQWKHYSNSWSDKILLKPGEYIDVDIGKSSELDANRPFKVAFFIFTLGADEPMPIVSEELIFDRKKETNDKPLPSTPRPSARRYPTIWEIEWHPLLIEIISVEDCVKCDGRLGSDKAFKFRVTNISNIPLKLVGTIDNDTKKYSAENQSPSAPNPFRPFFIWVKLDKVSGVWKYPTPDGKAPQWKDILIVNSDTFLLEPDEFMEFENVMSSELEANRPFKMAFYVLRAGVKEPDRALSKELYLK